MSNHLPILAQMANDAHDSAAVALRSAVQSAREAGEALNQAKGLVTHGEWAGWLKTNFKGGARTAQRYMRLAARWTDLLSKTARMSDLSVNEALRLLEARDELGEALSLKAEADVIFHELDVLKAAVDTASIEGLKFIIDRCQELHDESVRIRDISIREYGRLARELAVMP